MTTPGMDAPAIETVAPAQPGWDDVRAAWNLSIDQRPVCVALPRSADDIAATVQYAAARQLGVTAQTTGHQAGLVDLDETILIKTAHLDAILVDPEQQTLRVGAGVVWQDAVKAAAEHGLACLSGTAGSVGVTGYTLGGGLGWFGREYGLASNHVVAMDVATASGELLHIDAEQDRDLFWALRGGGGDFAIVTGWELGLFPIERVYAGSMLWPVDQAREVLTTWSSWAEALPEQAGSCARLLAFPALPQIDEHLRGKSFVGVELVLNGDQAEGEALIEPFRRLSPSQDNLTVMGVPGTLAVHGDPPAPSASRGDGLCLDALPPSAVEKAIEGFQPGSPLLGIEFRRLGGALGRPSAAGGAVDHLPGEFTAYCVGAVSPEVGAAAVQAEIDAMKRALAPWSSALGFANFSHALTDLGAFTTQADYARLTEIKDRYDPAGRIRGSHPVRRR